jgi:predicted phosphodiesterase
VRYLIISDIHGNWEALQAVLQDSKGHYDQILCCGDLVGYGADPDMILEWARSLGLIAVRGNHDKACAGLEDLEWFNPVARSAAIWTQHAISADNLEYLRTLARGPLEVASFQIAHGSPLDEDEYLVHRSDVESVIGYLNAPLFFFGHSHLQGGFQCHRNGVRELSAPYIHENSRFIELEEDSIYLVNPGSVGQPRDHDPRAAYLLYSTADRLVVMRRVTYDLATAQRKIVEAGLPPALAERLASGT